MQSTVNYDYGNSNWKDQLTSYNGNTITYDASGNPLNWRNASSMNWTGRQLDSMTLTDGTQISYAYNSDGLRVSKTVGGDTVKYRWDGTTLLAEEHTNYTLTFLYDGDTLIGFNYGGNNYYYGIDNLGVIHYIYNETGTVVVTYTYDAWGNTISASGDGSLININPIRYKSYYYDSETGLFYLQSRYYDPIVGRFISADDVKYLGVSNAILSYNIYIYVDNNPITYDDVSGNASVKAIGIGLQIEISIGAVTYGLEIIWYTSASIRQGRAWYIPYLYLYGGVGMSNNLTNTISKLTNNPSLLFKPAKLIKGEISICFFVIFGYKNFKKPEDYEGWFTCNSITIWNVKTYTAWGTSCFAIGVGASSSRFTASVGVTVYTLTSKIYQNLSNLRNLVAKNTKNIKP